MEPGSPGSPSSSRDSLSPIPSPVNPVKDPDFLPPESEDAKAPRPSLGDLTTPLKSPPPAAYDQKIVRGGDL